MKTTNSPAGMCSRIITTTNAVALAFLLATTSALTTRGADAPVSVTTGNGQVPVAESIIDTNSAAGKIQAALAEVKTKVEGAINEMRKATNSTPDMHAKAVAELATRIYGFATNELGDNSTFVQGAEALQAKFKTSIAKARAGASDPRPSRETYAQVLLSLEDELGRLIDAKASVSRVRMEMMNRAEALRADAEAIGFASDAQQTVLASKAFRKAISDCVDFMYKLDTIINESGAKGNAVVPKPIG